MAEFVSSREIQQTASASVHMSMTSETRPNGLSTRASSKNVVLAPSAVTAGIPESSRAPVRSSSNFRNARAPMSILRGRMPDNSQGFSQDQHLLPALLQSDAHAARDCWARGNSGRADRLGSGIVRGCRGKSEPKFVRSVQN